MNKNLLIPVFALFIINGSAQEVTDTLGDFKVKNSKVIYQKIFETDLNFDELVQQIRHNGIIKNPDAHSDEVTGETEQFDIDYKGAGVKGGLGGRPVFLKFKYSADVIIQYKDGRYRVTLKNIESHMQGERELFMSNETSNLEDIIVKHRNQKFRPVFNKNDNYKAFEYTFEKKFDFNDSGLDDDW